MGRFGGNEGFKSRYLDWLRKNYSESTYKNHSLALRNVKEFEDRYQRDLYEFTWAELVAMMASFNIKTKNAVMNRISMYSTYVDRARVLGIVDVNNLEKIRPDQYAELVSEGASDARYMTRRELFSRLEELENAQDQVVFALLFDGIMGKDYGELLSLRVEDIDFQERKANLRDGRTVKISHDTLGILEEAIDQVFYYTGKETVPEYPIIPNEFVVRACKRRRGTEMEEVTSSGLKSKIDLMKKFLGEAGWTGRTVYLSGVAERAIKDGMLGKGHLALTNWLRSHGVSTNASDFVEILKSVGRKEGLLD